MERRTVIDGIVEMSGRFAAVGADCAIPSTSLQSRYDRTLSDLPVSGSTVRLRLSVRRFAELRHTPAIVALLRKGIDYLPEDLRAF